MLIRHWHHACSQIKNSSEAYFIVGCWQVIPSWRYELISHSTAHAFPHLEAHCLTSLSSLSSISLRHPGASRLIISPQSQTHHFPSSRHQALSFPSSLSLVSVFTSQPHFSPCSLGFFLPPLCFTVWHLFTPHLPSTASSHSSTLISLPLSSVQIFYFSFQNFPCFLYPAPCSSLPT